MIFCYNRHERSDTMKMGFELNLSNPKAYYDTGVKASYTNLAI